MRIHQQGRINLMSEKGYIPEDDSQAPPGEIMGDPTIVFPSDPTTSFRGPWVGRTREVRREEKTEIWSADS